MATCQTLAVWPKSLDFILMDPSIYHRLELLPVALSYCVDNLADTPCLASRMIFLSFHMKRIFWLKCLLAELLCIKCLKRMSFEGEHLFGTFLHTYIPGIRVLSSRKEKACTHTDRPLAPENGKVP